MLGSSKHIEFSVLKTDTTKLREQPHVIHEADTSSFTEVNRLLVSWVNSNLRLGCV